MPDDTGMYLQVRHFAIISPTNSRLSDSNHLSPRIRQKHFIVYLFHILQHGGLGY